MATPINPKTGTVSRPTVPGKSSESKPTVSPQTGFVTGPTSQPRPVRPSLPEPSGK